MAMRELRVEDALLYLDQVKMEFGDRPHIYNEFLDIMKTFKTQQIDTPGVIRRVSTLFQGNKRLVLGFNTFLPEGYKIEIPDDGNGPPVAVYRAPGKAGVTQILGPGVDMGAPPAASRTGSAPGSGSGMQEMNAKGMPADQMKRHHSPDRPPQQQQMHPSQRPLAQSQHPQGPPPRQQQQHQQAFNASQQQQRPPGASAGAGGGMVESAAGAVGSQFQPHRMHSQQQAMQQMHQSQQPQQRGQQPPKSQHMPADPQGRVGGHEQQQPPRPGQHLAQSGQAPGAMDANVPGAPNRMGHSPPGGPPEMMQHQNVHRGVGQQQPPPQQQQQNQPPVEFDHAINYVTTIKKRFASEPDIYKKFLEILHTYQKEQRGIKDVLDEVSVLFSEHPDLLKEFTYFLPDAVQAQAKAQLDQVAKESEMRKRASASKQAIMQTARGMQRQAHGLSARAQPQLPSPTAPGSMAGPGGGFAPSPAPIPFGATHGRTEEREREIIRSAVYGAVSFAPERPPRRSELTASQAAAQNGRPRTIPEQPVQPSTAESAFFERAKLHLNRKELAPDKPPGSRRHTPYTEFLKCLHLYGAGILCKEELFLLLRGLFMQGHAPKSGANAGGGASNPTVASDAQELLREFEEIMVGRGPYADQETTMKDKSKYGSLASRDFDQSHAEGPTPSYRSYPHDYPHNLFLSHSGQTETDASVLNNSVLLRGTACRCTEQLNPRRNAYDDAMFRVEDERFEVDMAIECNVMAMRQIEPIAEEVTQLRENEEKDGQPIGRMHYKLRSRVLSSSQINAIARLYGEKGDEVVQHLLRNPIAVLPIVNQRLREKDAEWRKAKAEMSKRWKTLNEENYEGSLDTQCYFYRKELERTFRPAQLLEECKYAEDLATMEDSDMEHPATRPFNPKAFPRSMDEDALLFQPHLRIITKNGIANKNAFEAIIFNAVKAGSASNADYEKIVRIWAEFMVPWFGFPSHWMLNEMRDSVKYDKTTSIVKYSAGQQVRTVFGDGQIISANNELGVGVGYRVVLPCGVAYLRPSAILHQLPTEESFYARSNGEMKLADFVGYSDNGKRLPDSYKVVFGTEAVYIFLRQYCLLVSMLADSKDSIEDTQSASSEGDAHASAPGSPMEIIEDGNDAPAPSTSSSVRHNYPGVISMLKKHLAEDIDLKTYESYCRKATKEKVHLLAAVPKLVKSATESLLKVVKENQLLSLFDWCSAEGQDPVKLRSKCLNLTDDAAFRIQRNVADSSLSFSFVPADVELLTAPKETPVEDDQMEVSNDQEGDDYKAETQEVENTDDMPPNKRQKLD